MTSAGQRCVVGHRDEGNAIVEFVVLAMLLMLPLVYVLLAVFRVQTASYALSSAALEAGRVFATAPSECTFFDNCPSLHYSATLHHAGGSSGLLSTPRASSRTLRLS